MLVPLLNPEVRKRTRPRNGANFGFAALACHHGYLGAIRVRAGSAGGVCGCRLKANRSKAKERAVASQRQKSDKPVKSKDSEPPRRSQAADDDIAVTALGLTEAAPTDAMAAYF